MDNPQGKETEKENEAENEKEKEIMQPSKQKMRKSVDDSQPIAPLKTKYNTEY